MPSVVCRAFIALIRLVIFKKSRLKKPAPAEQSFPTSRVHGHSATQNSNLGRGSVLILNNFVISMMNEFRAPVTGSRSEAIFS